MENLNPEIYSQREMKAVDKFIGKCFGKFPTVFHELVSPDIHVDICLIPPDKDRNFHTLVTMGMGAHSWKRRSCLSLCLSTGKFPKRTKYGIGPYGF